MNSERLYEAIGHIDDDMIEKANISFQKKKTKVWIAWTAAAACLAIVCLGALLLTNKGGLGLRPLSIGEDDGSYGFEGYMAYDISELTSGNPWNENVALSTLPVYKNPVARDKNGLPQGGLSIDEMSAKITEAAAALGISVGEIVTLPTTQEIETALNKDPSAVISKLPTEAQASGDGVTIKVDVAGTVSVFFDNPIQLPQGYSFTYHDTTSEQGAESVSYLLNQYAVLLQFGTPVLDLFGDYNIYAQRSFWYGAYENSGSITDRIVNYAFNRVSFAPNEDGQLWIIRRYHTDLSEKVGDYPIITPDKAQELLLSGKFASSVTSEITSAEQIAKVELVYRNAGFEEYCMPYYRFYVELPERQSDDGLKTYGAYYVPAVEEKYIRNMPTYDGRFN